MTCEPACQWILPARHKIAAHTRPEWQLWTPQSIDPVWSGPWSQQLHSSGACHSRTWKDLDLSCKASSCIFCYSSWFYFNAFIPSCLGLSSTPISDHDILKFQCVLDWIRLPQIYKESTCLSSWWFFTSWRMSVKSSMCDLLYLGRQTWNLQHRSHVADCIPNTSNQMVHQNLGSMAGNELAGLANGHLGQGLRIFRISQGGESSNKLCHALSALLLDRHS